jgi:hypothetical protein
MIYPPHYLFFCVKSPSFPLTPLGACEAFNSPGGERETLLSSVPLWLVVYLPSEKYEFVSWDYEFPNIYIWKNKIYVPNHQTDIIYVYIIHHHVIMCMYVVV